MRLVLGSLVVTIFNTVRKLSRTINQANMLIIDSIIPELQYAIGTSKWNQAQKLFRVCVFSTSIFCGFGMMVLAIYGLNFYHIWTRTTIASPVFMWFVFVAGIIFNLLWTIASQVILAANKPYSFIIIASIMCLVALLISYVLALKFGLSGAAFGSLVMDVVLCVYLFPVSCKLIGQPIQNIFSTIKMDFKL